MSNELDRKTRPYFYVIAIALMIAGAIFHWNAWLVGGGLLIFMLIVFEDAKDDKAKAQEGKHEPRDRRIDESSKDQVPRM